MTQNVQNQAFQQTVHGNLIFNPPDSETLSEKCLRDLYLTDPRENMNSLKMRKGERATGTCEWFFKTTEFSTWLEGGFEEESPNKTSNVLWLYGYPGTGKSTMSICLIEELTKSFALQQDKTLIYFICDTNVEIQKTTTAILRGLLLQLIRQHQQLVQLVLPEYKIKREKLFQSVDNLWLLFEKMVTSESENHKNHVYCIIDALDECHPKDQQTLLQHLNRFYSSGLGRGSTLHILITSRPYTEIRELLNDFPQKNLASFAQSKHDVQSMIDGKVAVLKKRKRYTPKIEQTIKEILQRKAEGTFLWVGLACSELDEIASKDAVSFLERLPSGLDALYRRLLELAMSDRSTQPEDIQQILGFVAVAMEPLTITELSIACQLYQDEDEPERLQFTRESVESCRLMVVIEKRSDQRETVHLLHKSVKDFLFRWGSFEFPSLEKIHTDFANTCVKHLIATFSDPAFNPDIMSERLNGPFLFYSTYQWYEHARLGDPCFEVLESTQSFFDMESDIRQRWCYAYYITRSPRYTILHLAAKWGLPAIIKYICTKKRFSSTNGNREGLISLNELMMAENEHARTVLGEAASSPYRSVLTQLLDLHLPETTKSGRDTGNSDHSDKLVQPIPITEDVLREAAENRHQGKWMMELLLEKRGNEVIITHDIIMSSVGNWFQGKDILQLLLDRREDEIVITEEVIMAAISNESQTKGILELLLNRRGIEIVITQQIVNAAVRHGTQGKEILELLLDKRGTEINITEKTLKKAIRQRQATALLELLLDHKGAEIVITEQVVEAAIKHEYQSKEIMKLLLDRRGTEIVITEQILEAAIRHHQATALLDLFNRSGKKIVITERMIDEAVSNEYRGKDIIEGILTSGYKITLTQRIAKIAFRNQSQGSKILEMLISQQGQHDDFLGSKNALSNMIIEMGQPQIISKLLDKGADMEADCGEYGNCLQTASATGNLELVKMLIKRGAEVDAAPGPYGNALRVAAWFGHYAVVEQLIAAGAEVNGTHGTALQAAALMGRQMVMKKLLDKGADVDAQSGKYGTALYAASIKGLIYHTALCAASANGHSLIVKILLDAGAEVNTLTGNYGTALQAAAFGGHMEVVEQLVNKGANIHAQGGFYGTAIQAASRQGHTKVVEYLLAASDKTVPGEIDIQTLEEWTRLDTGRDGSDSK